MKKIRYILYQAYLQEFKTVLLLPHLETFKKRAYLDRYVYSEEYVGTAN